MKNLLIQNIWSVNKSPDKCSEKDVCMLKYCFVGTITYFHPFFVCHS